eukprot:1219556-Lingulodinium_polyedra.AAC.1
MRADKEIFRRLAEICRSGVRRDAGGERPLDRATANVLNEPGVRMLLMPLPGSAKRSRDESDKEAGAGESRSKRLRQAKAKSLQNLKSEVEALRKAADSRGGKGKGKGLDGGKGGGAAPGRGPRMPPGLHGKAYQTPDGQPICFSYNLGKCTAADHGGKCPRGQHVCAEWGCFKPHPITKHQ